MLEEFEFVETGVRATTGTALGGDIGTGLGASVLGEFVETGVGATAGAAVGGDGMGVGASVLEEFVKTVG